MPKAPGEPVPRHPHSRALTLSSRPGFPKPPLAGPLRGTTFRWQRREGGRVRDGAGPTCILWFNARALFYSLFGPPCVGRPEKSGPQHKTAESLPLVKSLSGIGAVDTIRNTTIPAQHRTHSVS